MTSTGILDTQATSTMADKNSDITIAHQNRVLTTMISSIVTGITIICCCLCIAVRRRRKNLKSGIIDEKDLEMQQNVNNKDGKNHRDNTIDFPPGIVNLRSVTSVEGENEKISDLEQGVNGVDASKSHDSLYAEIVHSADDIEVQPTHVKNVNSEGDGESPIIYEDTNDNINHDSDKEDVSILYDETKNVSSNKYVKSEDEYDTTNWESWNVDQVCKYIEYLLIENNYDSKDIDEVMNKVLLQMKITGKILKKLKANDILWKRFQNKIEDHSFGVWIAIAESLEKL